MNAIAFTFSVNSSFLRSSHPITIPKIHLDKLLKTKLDEETYIIIYPKGETLAAKMYHYRPHQHREYYQLTVPKRSQRLPDYLQIHDRLLVVLVRSYRVNYAILEYIQKPQTRYKNR